MAWEREERYSRLLAVYGSKLLPDDTARSIQKRLGVSYAVARDLRRGAWKAGLLPSTCRKIGDPTTDSTPVSEPVPETHDPRVVEDHDGLHAVSVNEVVRTPEELCVAAELDLDRWEIVSSKVNTWAVATKDADGDPVVTRLWQVRVDLKPRLVPLCPPAWEPPLFVPAEAALPPSEIQRCVILPDAQIGYRWVLDGTPHLDPHHDRAAIDIALQVIVETQPEVVILLGDMLDFAPLSTRWGVDDVQRQTTEPALREMMWLLWKIRGIAPMADIIYLEGNHEERLSRYLQSQAPELAGLRDERQFSLPSWLRLDDIGVRWVPYRDEFWLWDRVRIEHGTVVRSGGGSTVAATLKHAPVSSVQGHIHRCEYAERSHTTPGGRETVWALSPGCLCRVDGVVPGATKRSDWQQGVAVVTSAPGHRDDVELVRIEKGRALWRGRTWTGVDYSDALAESSGWGAFRRPAA